LAGLYLTALQRALRQVLQRLPAALPQVKSFPITVAEQIEVVRASLQALLGRAQVIRFEELMGRGTTRLEVVVTFLAVLELVKLHEIEVLQDETFGEIRLMPAAAWGASAAAVPAEAE
jgi:segregation and condensation protein A